MRSGHRLKEFVSVLGSWQNLDHPLLINPGPSETGELKRDPIFIFCPLTHC